MKTTFFSNYMIHHQIHISDYLNDKSDYNFIACKSIPKERIQLGYVDMNKIRDYIIEPNENKAAYNKAMDLAINSDIMIFGSGDYEFFGERIEFPDKLTFRYTERLFKKGLYRRFVPRTHRNLKRNFTNHIDKNMYVLCASAYTAYDLSLCGFPKEKCFKWGYFPEVITYDINKLIRNKEQNSILWVARFLDWKHPEVPIKVAERLKNAGYKFKLRMIGTGVMEEKIRNKIKKKNLEDFVECLGSMPQEQVRKYMEKSSIFIFTSDFQEGWGAVLNEAMNSGCACVASHAIGSVPYLIKDKENGLIYKNGNIDDVYQKVKMLLDNPNECRQLGLNAYQTMATEWNPKNAVDKLMQLIDCLQNGKENTIQNGVCSNAEIYINNWYRG